MNHNSIMTNRIITTGKPIVPVKTVKSREPDNRQHSFNQILQEAVDKNTGVKFSKHAEERLKLRNIQIDTVQMKKINNAVSKAEKKGVRESLVLMDNLAFVVSIKNKTIITAVNHEELKENIFTNIDSAVII